tara:strand:+ start:547 stop:3159 length:2613 start_codon:yes stop_codon:yes gene_type:complete
MAIQDYKFQSTAGESFRTPVETAVEPVIPPKTGTMALAETLKNVNPTLQKFLGNEINRQKPYLIQEGMNEVLAAQGDELRELVKKVQKRDGSRAARDLIGNNVFTQYGVEKALAINLGNAIEAKTNKFFKNYVVTREVNGQTISTPLSDYDVNSSAWKDAVAEFQTQQLPDTKGIRPELLSLHFLPKQGAALTKVFNDQVSSKAERTISNATMGFEQLVFGTYLSIDDYQKNIDLNIIDNDGFIDGYSYAFNQVQNATKLMVSQGLSEAVSPDKLLTLIENTGYKIVDYYLDNGLTLEEAFNEFEELTEFLRPLEVGQGNTLGSYYPNKLSGIKANIIKKVEEEKKNEEDLVKIADENAINKALDGLDFSSSDPKVIEQTYASLGKLKAQYGDRIDFINQRVDALNINVDQWFDNFELSWYKGEFVGKKEEAITLLSNFYAGLGSARTQKDYDRFDGLMTTIKGTTGNSYMEDYPMIQDSLNFAQDLLKETDSAGQVFIPPKRVDALYKLDKQLKEDIFDIRKDTKLDSVAKREKIRLRLDRYEDDVRKLAGNTNLFDKTKFNNMFGGGDGQGDDGQGDDGQSGGFFGGDNFQKDETKTNLEGLGLSYNPEDVVSDVNTNPFQFSDGDLIAANFTPINKENNNTQQNIEQEENNFVQNIAAVAQDFVQNPKEFTFDKVAKVTKVESSKNFVDFFLDEFINNNAEQGQDLTNLLTQDDQAFLKEETLGILNSNIGKTLLAAKDYQAVQDYVREQLIMGFNYNNRIGLQNSLGNGNYLDVEAYVNNNEIIYNNTYLFQSVDTETQGSDLLIRLPMSLIKKVMMLPLPQGINRKIIEIINNAPRKYVIDKIGEENVNKILDNPYRYTINLGKV